MPDQQVTTRVEPDEARAGNVVYRITRDLVGAVQIVRRTGRHRRRSKVCERITLERFDPRRIVSEAQASHADWQNMLRDLSKAPSVRSVGSIYDIARRRQNRLDKEAMSDFRRD